MKYQKFQLNMPSISTPTAHARRLFVVCLVLSLALTACAGNHRDQPKYEPQDESALFPDERAMRPLVEDTVARGQGRTDALLYTGKSGGKYVRGFPYKVDMNVLNRGQERYQIHCVPCHGELGDGQGMIVRRGYQRPPSFHQDRLRQVEEGYLYEVIALGRGAMPSYADQVMPRDRWAIVAYLRALQFSQNAKVTELPQEDRSKLPAEGR